MTTSETKIEESGIKSQAEKVVVNHIKYYKLWGFKIIAKSASGLVKVFFIGLMSFLTLFFLALSGAFALGKYFGSNGIGFLIVGGIFLLIVLILVLLRKYIFDKPVLHYFSDIYFKD